MTSASLRITTGLALAAALSVLAAYASAANANSYLIEYQAYTAALESGDVETAVMHGLAAWKAAEQALGDHRLTGIVAYNYGRLILFDAPEQAAAPLRRASELRHAGLVELPPDALRLYMSYAEFAASGFGEEAADELREALNAVGIEDQALIHDIATMWLKLTAEDLAVEEYRKAMKSAANAEAAVLKANPDASRELAQAILLGAVASLGRRQLRIHDLEAAIDQLARARRLLPPQKDLDSFDPLLAQVMAWQHASWRALQDRHDANGWWPPHSDDDDSPPPHIFQYQADGSLECDDFDWQERPSPNYPAGALVDGYSGTVILGYRLGEDLRVHDARILAEVPSGKRFGKVVLAALPGWRAKSLPTGGSECSYVKYFNFGIETNFRP